MKKIHRLKRIENIGCSDVLVETEMSVRGLRYLDI